MDRERRYKIIKFPKEFLKDGKLDKLHLAQIIMQLPQDAIILQWIDEYMGSLNLGRYYSGSSAIKVWSSEFPETDYVTPLPEMPIVFRKYPEGTDATITINAPKSRQDLSRELSIESWQQPKDACTCDYAYLGFRTHLKECPAYER